MVSGIWRYVDGLRTQSTPPYKMGRASFSASHFAFFLRTNRDEEIILSERVQSYLTIRFKDTIFGCTSLQLLHFTYNDREIQKRNKTKKKISYPEKEFKVFGSWF